MLAEHEPRKHRAQVSIITALVLMAGMGIVGHARGQQIANCVSTGDNKCFDDYKYIGPDGSTCDDFKLRRRCESANYSQWQMGRLYTSCPVSCGTCTFDGCTDNRNFMDIFRYTCNEWRRYNCSSAQIKYHYSPIQESIVIEKCPVACNACGERSDPACVFPFKYEGHWFNHAILRNGLRRCMTTLGHWKVAIPAGTPCVFPFVYEGVRYTTCTTAGTGGAYAWCPTLLTQSGTVASGHWAVCKNCNLKAVQQIQDCIITAQPTSAPSILHVEQEDDDGMGDNNEQNGMGDEDNGMNDNNQGNQDNGMNDNNQGNQDNGMNDNNQGNQDNGMNDNNQGNQDNGMNDNNQENQDNGMNDNNQENQDNGMNDNNQENQDNGMNDNNEDNGMNRRKVRRFRRQSTTADLPRYVSCDAQKFYEAQTKIDVSGPRVRVFDQSPDNDTGKSFWERLVDSPSGLGLFISAVLLLIASVVAGVVVYRRRNGYKILGRTWNPVTRVGLIEKE